MGNDPIYPIERALERSDNGEGYSVLLPRIESAQRLWACLREANDLYRTLASLQSAGGRSPTALNGFYRVAA